MQSQDLASEIVQKLPATALAALLATLTVSTADVALAVDVAPPPPTATQQATKGAESTIQFPSSAAPQVCFLFHDFCLLQWHTKVSLLICLPSYT